MDDILDSIGEAIHDFFVDACGGLFSGIFDDANAATGEIANKVSLTPSAWNPGVFATVQDISNNVVIPIAGLIITYVLVYELISMIVEKNNMHDIDTFMFFKYMFKSCTAVMLLSHTFEITMAIFDVGHWVVQQAASSITNDTNVDVTDIFNNFRSTLDSMDTGQIILLMLEAGVVGIAVKAIALLVNVVLINRMIEIYMYCSAAPIPFATMTNREWGNIGTNYIRSLLSLAFQGLFIMVIVGIYSELVQSISTAATDLHSLLMQIGMYSLVLCLTLFKTSSISKSIFNAR